MKKINLQRVRYNLLMAVEAVLVNKFRSFLTALGVIFGVAAVIAMLSIGVGAKKEIIDRMKYIGVNNIVITPKSDRQSGDEGEDRQVVKKFSAGLTVEDAEAIADVLPTVSKICPEVTYEVETAHNGRHEKTNVSGVTSDYFDVMNINLKAGSLFADDNDEYGSAVCVITQEMKSKFYLNDDPVGQYINCGGVNLKIVGVLDNVYAMPSNDAGNHSSGEKTGVYAPLKTVLLRYKDRSAITSTSFKNNTEVVMGNTYFSSRNEGTNVERHQLDRIVVHISDTKYLSSSAKVIEKILKRRHGGVDDYVITVPELLLKQEQRTKDIFNMVLGAIAGISLIVGGIGIMNIMLASVTERTREIGIRLAIGAKKSDIIFQFIAEATIISIIGGINGIILGIILSKLIASVTKILTIVSFGSIIVSFGVSVAVGILFGYLPAKTAALKNPVESLRHE